MPEDFSLLERGNNESRSGEKNPEEVLDSCHVINFDQLAAFIQMFMSDEKFHGEGSEALG